MTNFFRRIFHFLTFSQVCFSLSLSLSLTRYFVQFVLIFIIFLCALHSVLCTLIHYVYTVCGSACHYISFFYCACFFLLLATSFLQKIASHFSFMFAFLFAIDLFVLFHVIVAVLSFEWFKLKLECMRDEGGSSNVYNSAIFSFWCTSKHYTRLTHIVSILCKTFSLFSVENRTCDCD